MNEANISELVKQLTELGFEPAVESMLRCHACFAPPSFELVLARDLGAERCRFSTLIEAAGRDHYELKYYTATLRKMPAIPQPLEALDVKMGGIDWESLVTGRSGQAPVKYSLCDAAASVLQELDSLGVGADVLRYKYWAGTALEHLVLNLPAARAEWEITERFYFFDSAQPIRFDEALRFLGSRWMEKQMLAKRRLLLRKKEEGSVGDLAVMEDELPGTGSNAGGKRGGQRKLLLKNSRRTTRHGEGKG